MANGKFGRLACKIQIFAEYAKLCGGDGIRVEKASELDAAFEKAIASKGGFPCRDIDRCIAHINLF